MRLQDLSGCPCVKNVTQAKAYYVQSVGLDMTCPSAAVVKQRANAECNVAAIRGLDSSSCHTAPSPCTCAARVAYGLCSRWRVLLPVLSGVVPVHPHISFPQMVLAALQVAGPLMGFVVERISVGMQHVAALASPADKRTGLPQVITGILPQPRSCWSSHRIIAS